MTVEDWTTNLVKNLQRRGFYTLLPDETSLLNQQEFLKGNEGTLAQDLAGSDVGYAVTHDQDSNRVAVSLGKRPASMLSRQDFRCVCFGVICIGNPCKPASYLLTMTKCYGWRFINLTNLQCESLIYKANHSMV